MFTLLSPKAFASALVPSSPIIFPTRLSVVSVFEKTTKTSTIKLRGK
jgi:hypothetical protein